MQTDRSLLFRMAKYLLELYQTLYPEDRQISEHDLTNVTLTNVLTNGIYNDLGFIVKGRLLILVEAQSTWAENVVLRSIFYMSKMKERYLAENNLDTFGIKPWDVPDCAAYVLYTGRPRVLPDILRYSDIYPSTHKSFLDAKVNVLKVNEFGNDILSQYYAFCRICDYQISKYGRFGHKTLENIVNICLKRNILREFLEECRPEVMEVMDTLFDQKYVMDVFLNNWTKEKEEEIKNRYLTSGFKEGQEIGFAQGKEQGFLKGEEEGFAKGEEQGLARGEERGIIETCQAFGITFADTVQHIITKYGYSEQKAKEKVKQYWK